MSPPYPTAGDFSEHPGVPANQTLSRLLSFLNRCIFIQRVSGFLTLQPLTILPEAVDSNKYFTIIICVLYPKEALVKCKSLFQSCAEESCGRWQNS